MAEQKITKAMWYNEIKELVKASDAENKDEMVAFIDKQLEVLANRAAKAKERAEKNKVAGDEMRAAIEAVLTDELQVVDVIVAQVEFEGITKSKAVSRLTQLVDAGIAVKDTVKVEAGKRVAYKLA